MTATDLKVEPHVVFRDDGVFLVHTCHGAVHESLLNHRWSKDEEHQTIVPSINCIFCPVHGFWTNGEWKPV